MQTAKEKPEQYIINMIHKFTPDWEYIHFIDSEIITYFKNNPLKEFPNIIDKFNSFTIGQHKADLFRYYFLYINGGVFMDSDAMFEINIDKIIKNYDSIFVKSLMSYTCLFNGFIVTYPKNPIIYDALEHVYNTDNDILKKNYHHLCEQLWKIYQNHNLPNMKIYHEHNKAHEGYNNKIYNWGDDNYGEKHGGSIILNDEDETILNHYWHTKIIPENTIPKNIFQTWETKNITPKLQNIANIWKEKHPDYSYYLYDKNERFEFIKNNFDNDVLTAYQRLIPGAFKSDLWRYCVLYIYGGYYIDIDTLCLEKIDNVFNINNLEFVTVIDLNTNINEGTHNLANGFIGSMPNSPILLNAINMVVYNVLNKNLPKSPLDFTGPGVMGQSVNKYLNKSLQSSFKNKEGMITDDILLLKFEESTEYIKCNNKILFQNKNGNKLIDEAYKEEIISIKNNYVCWITSYLSNDINKIILDDNNNSIYIGPSNTTIKEIILDKEKIIGNIPINKQEDWWTDKFSTEVIDNKLIVKRIDENYGWGQELILPIKENKILLYNGFGVHYEMFGSLLYLGDKYNIDIDIVNIINNTDSDNWFKFYKKYYKFNLYNKLPIISNKYLFICLLTDDDMTFSNELINKDVICINHYNQNRRNEIYYQIPISNFNNDNKYIFPVFDIINYEKKSKIIKNIKPIIILIGESNNDILDNIPNIISNYTDFRIIYINRTINKVHSYIESYSNLEANKMIHFLEQASYVLWLYDKQKSLIRSHPNPIKNQVISGSFPLSFTMGCQLIIPSGTLSNLNLKSIIYYSDTKLKLNLIPDLKKVFLDREKLLKNNNNTFINLPHLSHLS